MAPSEAPSAWKRGTECRDLVTGGDEPENRFNSCTASAVASSSGQPRERWGRDGAMDHSRPRRGFREGPSGEVLGHEEWAL